METLASADSASPDTEPELHLLLERDRGTDWRRWRVAAIASVACHVVLVLTLLLTPDLGTNKRVYEQRPIVLFTPLYIPTELTQKAPNKGKISKELTVAAIPERPLLKAPSPAPPARKAPPPVPPPAEAPAPPQVAKVEPKVVITEPPKIQAANPGPPQPASIAKLTLPPPVEPPKLVFENVAPHQAASPAQGTQARVAMPNTSVEAAVRDLTKTGSRLGQSVGDLGADEGGLGAGLNLPPSAGRPHSSMELRSDPMGVDFRPYMLQVLAAVRRNWFAVYPEAARLGQRGEVVLEFAIAKQGVVTKVIFSTESGAKALDQSAVAAVSASNPLPPLPRDFKGQRIVLRMTFMYNMRQ